VVLFGAARPNHLHETVKLTELELVYVRCSPQKVLPCHDRKEAEKMVNSSARRFIGLDVHKAHVMVAIVDAQHQVLLNPRKVSSSQFQSWAEGHFEVTDQVVLEASGDAWLLVDQLRPLVERVVVANPNQVKLIASSMVKTDKRDALTLARLLAAGLIPEVWIPPQPVRELRALIQHREQLAKAHRAAINRLRSLCHRHHLLPTHYHLDAAVVRGWWMALQLPLNEQLIVQQNLTLLDELNRSLTAIDETLARLSVTDTWRQSMAFLLQLPGIGLCTGMTILSAIGDIARFPSAKQLVGYSGLGARVHSSGQTYRTDGVTKQGRPELRTALIEAAWSAVQHSVVWRQRFDHLAVRTGRRKAIVAIARKLLVVIWHVLSQHVPDHHADPDSVARSLMRWAAYHHVASSLGLPRTTFVRLELNRLGIGQELEQLRFSGRSHPLPPVHAVPPT
jgi:transposase